MASSPRIRRFSWTDLESFAELFNEVWGSAGTEKAFDADLMRQYLSQPTCQPEQHCFLAVGDDDSLLGFALVSPEVEIGRSVTSGGVLSAHRNQGIGRRLLKTAIEYVRALGTPTLHIQAPASDVGARHLLETEGFRLVKTYWQMRRENGESVDAALPAGFSFRSFVPGQDEEDLMRLQNNVFGEHWGFRPNTVEDIEAKVRFGWSDPQGIIFAADGDRLAAYNWTMSAFSEAGSTGWISMTGVDPDDRGKGLGEAVVVAGLRFLKERGVDGVELELDSENTPARQLYFKLGFRKLYETVWYEKLLES